MTDKHPPSDFETKILCPYCKRVHFEKVIPLSIVERDWITKEAHLNIVNEFIRQRKEQEEIVERDYITKKEYNKLKGYKLVYGCDCKRCKKVQKRIREEEKQKFIAFLENYQPYPKDIFLWDDKDKLDFNRGIFNRHCYEIVENFKEALKKELIKNEY